MKNRALLYLFFITIIPALLLTSCTKKDSGEWIAKIDNDIITQDDFETLYYAQHKNFYNITREEIDNLAADPSAVSKNPILNKQQFLEQVISQRLIYNHAISEGILENKEIKALIEMTSVAVIVGQYVKEKYKDEIDVADQEIEKLYSKQKKNFKGVPIEQAEMYIKQQLFQQKLQTKIRDLVENLREKKSIEKNVELLKEKG